VKRHLIAASTLAVAAGGVVAAGCRVGYAISSHWVGGYTSDAVFGISA
jgi:hypothetical protein